MKVEEMVRKTSFLKNKQMCKNIYYMLGYVVDELKYLTPDDVEVEDIESMFDLLAAMLLRALDEWTEENRGFRAYTRELVLDTKVHGEINFDKSISENTFASGKVYSYVNVLNYDTLYNRIIVLALKVLLGHEDDDANVDNDFGVRLAEYREEFRGMGVQEPFTDEAEDYLDQLDIEEAPEYYRTVLAVCEIVIKNILGSTQDGVDSLYNANEYDRWHILFENFVRNFYTDLSSTPEYSDKMKSVSRTNYKIVTYNTSEHRMQTDIVIKGDNYSIIYDAKWYTSISADTNGNANQVLVYREQELVNKIKLNPDYKVSIGLIMGFNPERDRAGIGKTEYKWTSYTGEIIKVNVHEYRIDMRKPFEEIKKELIEYFDHTCKSDGLLGKG